MGPPGCSTTTPWGAVPAVSRLAGTSLPATTRVSWDIAIAGQCNANPPGNAGTGTAAPHPPPATKLLSWAPHLSAATSARTRQSRAHEALRTAAAAAACVQKIGSLGTCDGIERLGTESGANVKRGRQRSVISGPATTPASILEPSRTVCRRSSQREALRPLDSLREQRPSLTVRHGGSVGSDVPSGLTIRSRPSPSLAGGQMSARCFAAMITPRKRPCSR